MTDREHFERIRARYLAAKQREDAYRLEVLLPKYGQMRPQRGWLTRTELKKLETVRRAQDREYDRFFLLLDRIAGRDFRNGVPWVWVMENLTYEDAITKGQLSVVPPVYYGGTERGAEEFAQAVA